MCCRNSYNEELGAVLQVRRSDIVAVKAAW